MPCTNARGSTQLCVQHCLNRSMQFECDPKTCPAGEACANVRIQKRLTPKLVAFNTGSRGWGLKCAVDLHRVWHVPPLGLLPHFLCLG